MMDSSACHQLAEGGRERLRERIARKQNQHTRLWN
jgi:hypothetical protein